MLTRRDNGVAQFYCTFTVILVCHHGISDDNIRFVAVPVIILVRHNALLTSIRVGMRSRCISSTGTAQ